MKPFVKNCKFNSQIERECLDNGESIEEMLRRATANNEPIEATAPMIYTEADEGVLPQYDIRTDRQELALDATDKWSKSERAKRENNPATEKKEETKQEQEQTNNEQK